MVPHHLLPDEGITCSRKVLMAESVKHKLFIVGGKDRNVPPWIRAAFEVEQFDQDAGSRGRVPEPDAKPDLIVVMKSWIGHKHYYDARELAERLGVPFIEAAGGWSSALQAAAAAEIDWFLKAIEATKDNEEVKASGEIVEEAVDNAWRQAYEAEWTKHTALEKRYAKDRKKFEEAQDRLRTVITREAAAQRVIAEVREAARVQRGLLDKATSEARKLADETRQRSERISSALANHLLGIETLIDRVSTHESVLIQAAEMIKETKDALVHNLRELTSALEQGEKEPQGIPAPSVTVAAPESSST
jgi:hypothetical protein